MALRFGPAARAALYGIALTFAACSARSGDLRAISGTLSGLEGTGLVLALNATTDGGSADRASLVAGATSFAFASQLTEGSSYAVTVATQPTSPPQTCSVTNGSGTLGNANVIDISVSCVTDSFSIGGAIAGLEGTGLILTLTDTITSSANRLSVAAGSTTFLFGTAITSGHAYVVTVDSAPVSPYQLCSISKGTGTIDSANVSGTVIESTTASTSYGFASITTGTTYTVTPSATGYAFSPASAEIVLNGSNVTQDFTVSCVSGYTSSSCSSGCCPKAIAISAGMAHSCAILYGGTVKCWGYNGYGQLGDGSTSDRLNPIAIADSSTAYSAITAGSYYTCGITTTAGTAKCWGYLNHPLI